jgi:hypothetical protein
MQEGEKRGWLDRPRNVKRIVYALATVCVLLVAGDLLYHKHTHFSWEESFGFYGFFGFVSFFLIVLSGRPLRRLLARDEDYYDR